MAIFANGGGNITQACYLARPDLELVFMDIFSRKIVGWQIYDVESSDLAAEVMRDICAS